MRKRLWLQFHLGTIALVGLLTLINFCLAMRPFVSIRTDVRSPSIRISGADRSTREPASTGSLSTPAEASSPLEHALKLVKINCEAQAQIEILADVRQLRLQFDLCPPTPRRKDTGENVSNDEILGVVNRTNGFEATLFDARLALSAAVPDSSFGTFTPLGKPDEAKKRRSPASNKTNVSTDFIALAPGLNEIVIRRTDREQIIRILRK